MRRVSVRFLIFTVLTIVALVFNTTALLAAPTFTQTAGQSSNVSAGTIAQAFSTGNTAGNFIVIAVSWGDQSATGISASDTRGNVYLVATNDFDTINRQGLAIIYASNILSGTNTVTVNFGKNVGYRRIIINEYSGIAAALPLDVTAVSKANGTTASNGVTSTASITTTSGDLIFGAVIDDSGLFGTITAGTGFTRRASLNNMDMAVEDKVQPAAGSTAATFTFSRADRYLAQMAAFKPAGAETTVPSIFALACNPTSVTSGTASTCTVSLTQAAPTGGSAVSLSSDNVLLSVPGSVTVPAGAVSVTFQATAGTITTSQTATVTATLNGNRSTVFFLNVTSTGSELESLAASMQSGTWVQLNTNNINPALTSSAGGLTGTILTYAEYIKWDPVRHRLHFIGGDHNGTSHTQQMKHVQYDEVSNSWTVLPSQSWFTIPVGLGRHGLDHGAIDPEHRYFYFRQMDSLTVQRYNLDTETWTKMPDNDIIQYNSCCVGLEYFPELQGVLWIGVENGNNAGITRLNDQTGQWDRIAQPAAYPIGGYENFAEYNPVHQVVLFGGGAGGWKKIHKLDPLGVVTALRDAPVDLGILDSIVTVDPVSGDYLIFTTNEEFYVYNVTTDTWTLEATGSSVPIWTTSYPGFSVHGVVGGSINTYGVNVFVTCDGPNACTVNLYKHSSGN
jgi:hypothetical protein